MSTPIWLNPSRSHIEMTRQSLSSILFNRVKLTPKIDVSIEDIANGLHSAFQSQKEALPRFMICHKGSDLAQLFVSNSRIADHDIQIILFPESPSQDPSIILSQAQEIANIFFNRLVQNRSSSASFIPQRRDPFFFYGKPDENGITSKHGMTRFCFAPSSRQDLPLDISIHTLDPSIKTLSSFSLEAFYMPVDGLYRIYSEMEGDIVTIIDELQQRILQTTASKPHKFGFYRFITALTHMGFTAPNLDMSRKLMTVDSDQGPYMLVEMRKYITEKKIEGPYFFYLLNAFFCFPDDHPLFPRLAEECLKEAFQHHESPGPLGFISQLLSEYRPYCNDLISPETGKKILAELKLFLPLLSYALSIKAHGDRLYFICQFPFEEKVLFLLVPLLKEEPHENLLDLLRSKQLNSIHDATIHYALDLISTNQFPFKWNKWLLTHSFDPETLTRFLKEGSTDTFSDDEISSLLKLIPTFISQLHHRPFPPCFLLNIFLHHPQKQSADLAYQLIRYNIQRCGNELDKTPPSFWQELLLLGRYCPERKGKRWMTLLHHVLSLPPQTLAISSEDFKTFVHFIFDLISFHSFKQAKQFIKAIALLGGKPLLIDGLIRCANSEEADKAVNEYLTPQKGGDPLAFEQNLQRLLSLGELQHAQQLIRYQTIILQNEHFPSVVEQLLIDALPSFEMNLEIHLFFAHLFQVSHRIPSNQFVSLYFSLLINQLDYASEQTASLFLASTSFYLPHLDNPLKFNLINRCCQLPIAEWTRQLFALVLTSTDESEYFMETFPWNDRSIAYCIDFLKFHPQLNAKKQKAFITQLHQHLLSCNIASLSEDEIDFLSEKMCVFLQLIPTPCLKLPIHLLLARPDKTSVKLTRGSIKQLLDLYQNDLKIIPDSLWEECSQLARLSPQEPSAPWNTLLTTYLLPLLIRCHQTPPKESIIQFINLLAEKGCAQSLQYYIQAFILLGDQRLLPFLLLDDEKGQSYIKDILIQPQDGHMGNAKALSIDRPPPTLYDNRGSETGLVDIFNLKLNAYIRPFLTEALFSTLLENHEWKKALKIIQLKEPLPEKARGAAYRRLFKKSVLCKERTIAAKSLSALQENTTLSSFINLLSAYHENFPDDLHFFHVLLDRKKELIAPVYSTFHTSASLAKLIEDQCLINSQPIPLENDASSNYQAALIARMEETLRNKEMESTTALIEHFPAQGTSYKHAFINIVTSFLQHEAPADLKNRVLKMTAHHFPDSIGSILSLHEQIPYLTQTPFIHEIILFHAKKLSPPLPQELLATYATLFIEQCDKMAFSSSKVVLEQAALYFLPPCGDFLFSLALKCVSSRSNPLMHSLFRFATASDLSLLTHLSHYSWTVEEVRQWLLLLPEENAAPVGCLSKETFATILLKQMFDFSLKKNREILIEIHPILGQKAEHLIVEQYQQASTPAPLSFLTHSFFSPILLKAPPLYRDFLISAQTFIQDANQEDADSKMILKKLLKLVQQPAPVEDADHERFRIASFCITTLSSYSGNLSWISEHAARNMPNPLVKELFDHVMRLSPHAKNILPFLRALTDLMTIRAYEDIFFEDLDRYLFQLLKCHLKEADLAEAAPLLKKIPDYLIESSYLIPQSELIKAADPSLNKGFIAITIAMKSLVAGSYALTPPHLFACGQKLIELLSQYQHVHPSAWYEDHIPRSEQESPIGMIERMTIQLHMNKLKIAAHIKHATNCIPDLAVYASHLKRMFITKEIQPDFNAQETAAYFLTCDELITISMDIKKRFPLDSAEVGDRLLEVISEICSAGITHPRILDLALARLALTFYQRSSTEAVDQGRITELCRQMLLSLNTFEKKKNGPSVWNFAKSIDFLKMYQIGAGQTSLYLTFSSPPAYRLPRSFIIQAIERPFKLLSDRMVNKELQNEILLKEDLSFLLRCTYFASEYTVRARDYPHFLKKIPITIMLYISDLFPNEEGIELIKKIFWEIQTEEQTFGLDSRHLFMLDLNAASK